MEFCNNNTEFLQYFKWLIETEERNKHFSFGYSPYIGSKLFCAEIRRQELQGVCNIYRYYRPVCMPEDSMSPLHVVAKYGTPEHLQILLQNNEENINILTLEKKHSLLEYAVESKNKETFDFIINHPLFNVKPDNLESIVLSLD